MNAKGLTMVLSGVSARLHMAFYETLVTNREIKQDELDGTRKLAVSAIAILRKAPSDKLEALVAKFDRELTSASHSFNSKGSDPLGTL